MLLQIFRGDKRLLGAGGQSNLTITRSGFRFSVAGEVDGGADVGLFTMVEGGEPLTLVGDIGKSLGFGAI